jgi:outer membrane protein assembly factor BamE (lipoprotein component of BamABCDE complex)
MQHIKTLSFKYLNLLLYISTILHFTSCSQIEKKGYSFELSEYQNLQEKINSKKDTLNFMGQPSFISETDQKEFWVYYSEDIKKFLFFKPEAIDRKIVTITFNNKNIVENIKTFDLKDQNLININPNYTEVASQKKSWWSQIFGNIGQVRAN